MDRAASRGDVLSIRGMRTWAGPKMGTPAFARTPVLPEATLVGALSALRDLPDRTPAGSAGLDQSASDWPELCRFLGAGNNETLRTLSEPASKKRRGTKSREVGQPAGQRALWGLALAPRSRLGRGELHACTRHHMSEPSHNPSIIAATGANVHSSCPRASKLRLLGRIVERMPT